MGDGKSFYCGILMRGIQNSDKWIYGPGRVAYSRAKSARKIDLELIPKTHPSHYFITEHCDIANINSDMVFRLPRHNLSTQTLHEQLGKGNKFVIEHFKSQRRYVRLPEDFLKRSKNDLPQDYALLVRTHVN